MKLYDYYRSSASFRVRIALNLKGLTYQEIPVHLLNKGGEQFSVEYQAINPQCLVPALQDGEMIVTQSLAIMDYLDELHPMPPLLPHDPYEKALARSFALIVIADMHPLNNLRVLHYLTQELGVSEEQKSKWYQHWVAKGFAALERQLATYNTSEKFCFGSSPTIADICLAPQMYNARRFSCDLSAYPILMQIDANCQKHPAFMKAWPDDKFA